MIREYTDDAGKTVATVTLGQQVQVHVKYRSVGTQKTTDTHKSTGIQLITDVALVDLLPAGFELVIPPEQNEGSACTFCLSSSPTLQFADPREDRVVFYGSVTSDVQEVAYRIKATNVGLYTVPPAYGEAMYDRTQRARSVAAKIEVTRP